MTPPSDPSSRTAAQLLFDEHLARLERGEPADLEGLCAAHPEEADELRRLEGLIHPLVEQERRETIGRAQRDPAVRAVVWDVPLLFEKQLDRQCDCVIFVHADRAVRLERLVRDRGWDENELDRREKKQMALDRKRRSAHYIIDNGSSEAACFAQVRDVFTRILTSRQSSTGPNQPAQG